MVSKFFVSLCDGNEGGAFSFCCRSFLDDLTMRAEGFLVFLRQFILA